MTTIHRLTAEEIDENCVDEHCEICGEYEPECDCDERCFECDQDLAESEGDGRDGLCGSCADIAEREGRAS